jgi:hypothetical protein
VWHGKPRLEQGRIGGEGWFRPDQDAAGRLLEGPSDRTPRGMTVRTSNCPTEPGLQTAHSNDWPLTVILPREASYHIGTMRRHNIVLTLSFLAVITLACTARKTPPRPPAPISPEVRVPGQSVPTYLRFSANVYRYRFQQRAHITAEASPDTVPSTIVTQALILVAVTADADSSIRVSVSFDSISISTQGSIPSRGLSQVTRLDSVLQVQFSNANTRIQMHSPDSLCAYGQFVSAARDLLLPELAIQVISPGDSVYTDTIVENSCRAGTSIEMITTQQLQDLGHEPPEFSLQQQAEIRGVGLLRRDSIAISGSIATFGTATFATANRLPSLVQTNSKGMITVRLGTITTVFSQISQQEIRLEGISTH